MLNALQNRYTLSSSSHHAVGLFPLILPCFVCYLWDNRLNLFVVLHAVVAVQQHRAGVEWPLFFLPLFWGKVLELNRIEKRSEYLGVQHHSWQCSHLPSCLKLKIHCRT